MVSLTMTVFVACDTRDNRQCTPPPNFGLQRTKPLKPWYVGQSREQRMDQFDENRFGYRISHDADAMDLDAIHAYLSGSYWSPGIR
ncbi:MAG: hypothetical protein ABUL62_22730 [Myxococcales bacterium]